MSDHGFGKFYARAFTGSMMGSGSHVYAVMGYAISHARPPDGEVELNPKLLATLIGDTEERMVEAITYLTQPDRNSRSKACKGKRLVTTGQFSYRLVNFSLYREGRSEHRAVYMRNYMREYQRRKRGRKS